MEEVIGLEVETVGVLEVADGFKKEIKVKEDAAECEVKFSYVK